MRRSLFATATAFALVAGVGLASAQSTTTTTTWTTNQGPEITRSSTTNHYSSFSDPGLNPTVGMALPGTVTLYPLPNTVQVPDPNRYSYTIINNQPVVVERTTRTVVHTWQ